MQSHDRGERRGPEPGAQVIIDQRMCAAPMTAPQAEPGRPPAEAPIIELRGVTKREVLAGAGLPGLVLNKPHLLHLRLHPFEF